MIYFRNLVLILPLIFSFQSKTNPIGKQIKDLTAKAIFNKSQSIFNEIKKDSTKKNIARDFFYCLGYCALPTGIAYFGHKWLWPSATDINRIENETEEEHRERLRLINECCETSLICLGIFTTSLLIGYVVFELNVDLKYKDAKFGYELFKYIKKTIGK